MVSTAVEVNRVGCAGMCLIIDFKGSMMEMPFEGHGTQIWDPKKKKYVGTWIDSMSPGVAMDESTYDPATRTMTGWMEGPDLSGNITKMKSVTKMKDDNTRVMEMHSVAEDGSETLGMRVTYTRKK
jgi:hypothetical protein